MVRGQHHHADLLLRHLRRAAADEAIDKIKGTIKKTYGKKGDDVVRQNYQAVDATLEHLYESGRTGPGTSIFRRPPLVPDEAPEFVKKGDGGNNRRVTEIDCRSASSPSTEHTRRPPPSGKNATWDWRFPFGTRHLHTMQQMRPSSAPSQHPLQGYTTRPCWPRHRSLPLHRL